MMLRATDVLDAEMMRQETVRITAASMSEATVPSVVNAPFHGANDAKMGLWDEMDFSMSTHASIVEGFGRSGMIEG